MLTRSGPESGPSQADRTPSSRYILNKQRTGNIPWADHRTVQLKQEVLRIPSDHLAADICHHNAKV